MLVSFEIGALSVDGRGRQHNIGFIVYSICRLEYLFENWSYFSQSVGEGRLWGLLMAGLRFDTPGIFYTNALYVLLMLLPLHYKERAGWRRMCKWLFIVVNSIMVIVNLADSVYFSYTLRRTSWSVFGEFGNETNLGKVAGVELLSHWYLVVLAAALIWGCGNFMSTPPSISADRISCATTFCRC